MLEAIVERVPPPEGEPEAPPRALIFDSEFDQYRGVVAFVRMMDGSFAKREPIKAMQTGTQAEIDDIGFFTPGDGARPGDERRRGRLRDHRHQGRDRAAGRRHADQPREPRERCAARLPRGAADGVLRPLPDRHRPLRGPARRPGPPRPQRRRALLRARDLGRARLRLPLRLPRPAAHGHRPRAARARVRPGAAGDHPERPLRGEADQRRAGRGPQPHRHAGPGTDRGGRWSPTSAPPSSPRTTTSAR